MFPCLFQVLEANTKLFHFLQKWFFNISPVVTYRSWHEHRTLSPLPTDSGASPSGLRMLHLPGPPGRDLLDDAAAGHPSPRWGPSLKDGTAHGRSSVSQGRSSEETPWHCQPPNLERVSEDWSCRGQHANSRGCVPAGAGTEVRDAVRSRAFFSAEVGDKGFWQSVLNNKAPLTQAGGSGRRGGEEKDECWVSFSQSKPPQPRKKNYRKRNKHSHPSWPAHPPRQPVLEAPRKSSSHLPTQQSPAPCPHTGHSRLPQARGCLLSPWPRVLPSRTDGAGAWRTSQMTQRPPLWAPTPGSAPARVPSPGICPTTALQIKTENLSSVQMAEAPCPRGTGVKTLRGCSSSTVSPPWPWFHIHRFNQRRSWTTWFITEKRPRVSGPGRFKMLFNSQLYCIFCLLIPLLWYSWLSESHLAWILGC